MSAGGRLQQPTDVVAPGAAALALQAANDLNRLIIDDATRARTPTRSCSAAAASRSRAANTLRGGDTATGARRDDLHVGGQRASGNAYRLRPLNALGGAVDFVSANPRPAAPGRVGGTSGWPA